MQVDPARAAANPAIAEYLIGEQQAEISRLLALVASLAPAEPLAPEALRAALAQQPQALEFSADAI
ncbi:hypothetical protein [Delftia acidovorans]|uniref:hypothetical protein n=1 Tax=Delftia acidovorans TaxID=80866 RepID=UPI00286F5171|nr:hypothetical protein [Delftia acidovorans]